MSIPDATRCSASRYTGMVHPMPRINHCVRLNFCVACGDDDPDHLQHHHLVPRSCGGGDEECDIITLCAE